MKRWLIAMTTFALVTAACTAGGGSSSDAPSAIDTGSGASHAPVTLQMWGAWTGRELQQFNKIFDGFTKKYKVWKLVYFEVTSQIDGAIEREKQLKAGPRHTKVELIESTNPRWRDLYHDLLNGT